MIKQPLTGHISEDTAYIVDDYPYGFTLRCKIRYWIESHPSRGFRACSQTLNPKTNRWNKPKKSTYTKIAEGMFLNEDDHVKFCGLSEYSELTEAVAFKEKFYECLNSDARKNLNVWIILKTDYNEDKKQGKVSWNGEPMEAEDIGPEHRLKALEDMRREKEKKAA